MASEASYEGVTTLGVVKQLMNQINKRKNARNARMSKNIDLSNQHCTVAHCNNVSVMCVMHNINYV